MLLVLLAASAVSLTVLFFGTIVAAGGLGSASARNNPVGVGGRVLACMARMAIEAPQRRQPCSR